MGSVEFWEGKDWQKHIEQLLKLHYPLGDYVPIPDKDGGDKGIEGFSRDGRCFQCYAAEEPLTIDELYKKQRKKITEDINKFKENQKELSSFFGPTKITRWILVVPRHETNKLVTHAEKKAREVREANLPYVGEEFYIHIVTREYFSKELNLLRKSTSHQLHIEERQIQNEEVKQWIDDDTENLVHTLDSKIKKLPTIDSTPKINAFRFEIVKKYIAGQNTLSDLQYHHPYIYETVDRCKNSYESQLAFNALMNSDDNNVMLNSAMEDYKTNLTQEVETLSNQTLDYLKFEAISDWLIRCPLDFY